MLDIARNFTSKQEIMRNVDEVQAACSDILADARQINAERDAAEEAAYIEDVAEEATQG